MEMKYNGVRIYCLPDDNFCLKDEEHRSPLELDECPLGEDVCTGDCFYYSEDSEERRCHGVNGLPERDDSRSCGK